MTLERKRTYSTAIITEILITTTLTTCLLFVLLIIDCFEIKRAVEGIESFAQELLLPGDQLDL